MSKQPKLPPRDSSGRFSKKTSSKQLDSDPPPKTKSSRKEQKSKEPVSGSQSSPSLLPSISHSSFAPSKTVRHSIPGSFSPLTDSPSDSLVPISALASLPISYLNRSPASVFIFLDLSPEPKSDSDSSSSSSSVASSRTISLALQSSHKELSANFRTLSISCLVRITLPLLQLRQSPLRLLLLRLLPSLSRLLEICLIIILLTSRFFDTRANSPSQSNLQSRLSSLPHQLRQQPLLLTHPYYGTSVCSPVVPSVPPVVPPAPPVVPPAPPAPPSLQ
ncbi:hypothetical protein EI94DRAFT_1811166 [Lactarius quietus]|nr:hypothetical protein EI94DRAFT_1811166 [Lactarius quietus]